LRWKARAPSICSAGTGALGLEAISQGAIYALFVEDDAQSGR